MNMKNYATAMLLAGSMALSHQATAQEKPYEELFRLADINYSRLVQHYETSRGTLRSVMDEDSKYGYQFDIILEKGGHKTEVAYRVMGHNIMLDIRADSNGRREAYGFHTDGKPFDCRSFAIDQSGSPVRGGGRVEYSASECEKMAKPHMDNLISALKEYERKQK